MTGRIGERFGGVFRVWLGYLLLLLAATVLARQPAERNESAAGGVAEVALADLPAEARRTLALIRAGGPYPYDRDGIVFGNREGLLPRLPRGGYSEFTVPTPGARDRGPRRIVAAGAPGAWTGFWYTADHYRSFQRIREVP